VKARIVFLCIVWAGVASTSWGATCFCKVTADGQEIKRFEEGGYSQLFQQGKCRAHCQGVWDGSSSTDVIAWAQAARICQKQVTVKMDAAVGTASYQTVREGLFTVPACTGADSPWFRYSAKFLCGRPPVSPDALLKNGEYFTAVNIFNPNSTPVDIRKLFSLGSAFEKSLIVSEVIGATVGKMETVEVQCSEILKVANAPNGQTGFAVIDSPAELDVVSVLTAGPIKGEVATLHTERVPPRRVTDPVQICADTTLDLSTGQANWTVRSLPSGNAAAAIVQTPVAAWGSLGGASWAGLSSDGSAVQPAGDYEYETCFCACQNALPKVQLQALADNSLQVFINSSSSPVYSWAGPSGNDGFTGTSPVADLSTGFVANRQNCIKVKVHNNAGPAGGTATGLAVHASVAGARPIQANGACR
jgi:hypothetical protein